MYQEEDRDRFGQNLYCKKEIQMEFITKFSALDWMMRGSDSGNS